MDMSIQLPEERTTLNMSDKELGTIIFCLGQVATNSIYTDKNREEAKQVIAEITNAAAVAKVIM